MNAPTRRAGIAAIVAAALVVLAWFAAPAPPAAGARSGEAEAWRLPPLSRPPAPALAEQLAKANLWGTLTEAAASAPLNDPPWRFVGIVRQGGERFVLIKVDGRPEVRLTVNDRLPGGSEIVDIGEDALCILINGQKRRLAIYRTESQIL